MKENVEIHKIKQGNVKTNPFMMENKKLFRLFIEIAKDSDVWKKLIKKKEFSDEAKFPLNLSYSNSLFEEAQSLIEKRHERTPE